MKRYNLILLHVFILCTANAQVTAIADTVEYARSLVNQNNFEAADRLLSVYNSKHTDINALRLHAQLLYWMEEYQRSSEAYENALKNFPDVQVVKLDYGRMKFDIGQLRNSEQLLNSYIISDPQHVEANILLAQIKYWKGEMQKSQNHLATVLTPYPTNEPALNLRKEMNQVTAPYIKAGLTLASDDQPLDYQVYSVEAGWYKSWIFSPEIRMDLYRFRLNTGNVNTSWVQAGNSILFGLSGLSVRFKGGLFRSGPDDKNIATGAITAIQKLTKSLSVDAGFERRPYQYTVTSIGSLFIDHLFSTAINLNINNAWLGKAAYEHQKFPDDHKIQTMYAWFLGPVINHKNVKFNIGSSFSHAIADHNTFTSKEPLSTLIATTTPGSQVEGHYDPYFTPNNQNILAILASAEIQLGRKVNFTSRLNLGVVSSADHPYLIFVEDPADHYYIFKGYYKESYTPVDFQNQLHVQLSSRITLSATYAYSHLLFYTIHHGTMQIKYSFRNE